MFPSGLEIGASAPAQRAWRDGLTGHVWPSTMACTIAQLCHYIVYAVCT